MGKSKKMYRCTNMHVRDLPIQCTFSIKRKKASTKVEAGIILFLVEVGKRADLDCTLMAKGLMRNRTEKELKRAS
jgi:hypothetical protein